MTDRRELRTHSDTPRGGPSRTWHRLLSAVLTMGLLMLGPGAPRFAQAQAVAAARTALTEMMDATRALADGLDRASFDVDELSLELAFEEPEDIVALVREQVAFEQYPGLLRGAQGTLVSGAGNSLDQALLLAVLLGGAGFDTRIAEGQLTTEQAEQLLQSMQPTASTRPQQSPAPAPVDQLATLVGADQSSLAAVGEEFEAQVEALRTDASAMAERLQTSLTEAGLMGQGTTTGGSGSELVTGLVAEAQHYFWVEYGLGGDDWTPVHVLFDEDAGLSVTADRYLSSSVPEELQHRFRFQVFIEQRVGDEFEVKPVTAAWERPTANMFGLGFDFVNLPDGFGDADSETDIEAVLDGSEFFTPVFNGAVAEGAQTFDLEGNALDPADAANQAAGVFKNVGGAFGRAAGALAGEEDPDAFVALTAQWIEYTMIAPGGAETTHRRTVFDRVLDRASEDATLDPDVSDADVKRALATSYSFMLDTGHYSESYITHRGVQMTLAAEPLLSRAMEQPPDAQDADLTVPPDFQQASRGADLLRLFAAFDAENDSPTRISYRADPSLVVIERSLTGDWAGVDVVDNARRVLEKVEGELPRVDLAGAIEAGAWETRIEGLPITAGATEAENAYTLLEEAWSTGATRLIAPAEASQIDELALHDRAKTAIEEDLQRGYAVIVPSSGADDLRKAAWWRVDPRTGETLGRTADGRGGEFVEELQLNRALMIGGLVLGAHTLVLGCLGKGSTWATACCLYEGVLINAGMIAIGAVIGAYFAVPALALFLLLDIGVGGGMMVAGFMNKMPTMCSTGAGTCRYRVVI